MKLYRTRTQEEFDWLMQKLEDEGCKWSGGDKPTNNKDARDYANEVVVYLDSDKILTWNFVRDVESKRLKNIIEVSGLMKQHPLATKVEERNNKLELVNHPDHYQGNKFEVIDIIEDYELNFTLGSAVKYILRAGKKDDKNTDLKKAIWMLERELEEEE